MFWNLRYPEAYLFLKAFNTIVKDVSEIAKIIASIADSSADQEASIGQITNGINNIAGVVQTNSATSEEAAASAEELSNQSDLMLSTVTVFKLRGNA